MDDDKETLFLCKHCAEEMKEYKTVASVEYIRPARDKGTCEQCRLRRYGYMCEVEFREPEAAEFSDE